GSWSVSAEPIEDWRAHQASRGFAILRVLWSAPELRVVFAGPRFEEFAGAEKISLPAPSFNFAVLDSEAQWGPYAEPARALALEIRRNNIEPSTLHPLPIRFAVGAIALDGDRARIHEAILRPSSAAVPILSRIIHDRLERKEHEATAAAVQMFLR